MPNIIQAVNIDSAKYIEMGEVMKRYLCIFICILCVYWPISRVDALELPKEQAIQATNQPEMSVEALIAELPKDASIDDPFLVLINRNNRLDADMLMDFAYTVEGHPYDVSIYDAFNALLEAAELDGHSYQVVSAHRTIAYQEANFNNRMYSYINAGYSEDEAFFMTDQFVAPPDATEHATGLAFDLLGYDYNEYGRDLHQVYGQYPSAIWLQEHGPEYGFIVRYPAGKEEKTGYQYEPWHIRYVGSEAAQYMDKYGLTLEEYLTLIELSQDEA